MGDRFTAGNTILGTRDAGIGAEKAEVLMPRDRTPYRPWQIRVPRDEAKLMPLRRDRQQRKGKTLNCAYARGITLIIFLFVGSVPHSQAQLPKPAAPPLAKTEALTPVDPLGRETPRGAVMGLLKY